MLRARLPKRSLVDRTTGKASRKKATVPNPKTEVQAMDPHENMRKPEEEVSTELPNEENAIVNRHFSSVDKVVGLLLGLAGLVFGLAQYRAWDTRLTIECSIAVLLVTAIYLFYPVLRRLTCRFPVSLSLVLAMASLLAVISFHLFTNAPVIKEVRVPAPQIVTQTSAAVTENSWTIWEQQIEKEVDACKADHRCIAEAISKAENLPPKPPAGSENPGIEQLNADIRAGSILMNIKPVFDMLQNRIGIKSSFLGDGFAKPNEDGKQYWDARVPEFLVQNHPENDDNLWTWELSPDYIYLNMKLADIIGSSNGLIKEISHRDHSKFLNSYRSRLSIAQSDPAVIRFSRFPREKDGKPFYSRRIGRSDAKRVFVLHLGAVQGLTLSEAAKLSGYSLNEVTKEDKFWVWVYLPRQGELELNKPTWGNIIPKIDKWVKEP
jgi:hypothetical protein